MTLLHFDGFDAADMALRYTGSGSTSTTTAFSSGRSASINSMSKAVTASSRVVAGVRIQWPSGVTGTEMRPFLSFLGDGGTVKHITVGLTPNGVRANRGAHDTGTQLELYSGTAFEGNSWHYLEVEVTVADSGGVCKAWLNGNLVINQTSADTRNGGTATTIDTVQIGANGVFCLFDDFYILNDSGSAPYNARLGDVRVATIVPTAAGNSTGMTPSTGSNWQTVDELPYSASDYNTGSAGQKDTYTLADLPAGVSSVLAVQTNLIAKKTDAGALSIRTVARSSSTDYVGSTTGLSTSDTSIGTMYTADPATSTAWTTSGVNALQAGAEVV